MCKRSTKTVEQILEAIKKEEQARAEKMPDEKTAIKQMFEAFLRLKELGWKEARYYPKDGSYFSAIEAGSTGIHKCDYRGGGLWIYDGDVWPADPILWRPRKEGDPELNLGLAIDPESLGAIK